MAVLMIMEPQHAIQPLEIQETPGLPNTAVEIVVESGDSLVASTTAVPGTILLQPHAPCVDRHGRHFASLLDSLSWISQCVPVGFEPRYGAAYHITVSREGRRTATASTVVPGDFDIVEYEIAGEPARHVSATWTRSAGAYRYLVALGGIETNANESGASCRQPSCVRWFAVTQDTTIATAIDARFVENTSAPYAIKVWALSRELFDGMMTGATSGFFPVPPAQNVFGGMGTIGAWVRRWAVTLQGVKFQNLAAGVRISNTSAVDMTFSILALGAASGPCSAELTFCGTLAPGGSTMVPRDDIPVFPGTTDVHISTCQSGASPGQCINIQIKL
jgi:hypothetical protein